MQKNFTSEPLCHNFHIKTIEQFEKLKKWQKFCQNLKMYEYKYRQYIADNILLTIYVEEFISSAQ